jgi:hypothetical protein
MSQPEDGGPRRYQVHVSGALAAELRRLQRQAAREGRGGQFLAALRYLTERLEKDPNEAGEPLYRLPNLRVQVRTMAVRPLLIDFAVCEDRPLVFLNSVKLLSQQPS